MQIFLKIKHFLLSLFLLFSITSFAANYYVDFNSGNDSNNGTSQENAWKHCPGDENAENIPASINLQPGDIIYFKGGVIYQGNITLNASGDSLNHITYKGDGWGSDKAIIDGSMPITEWTALNDSIYYANIPEEFTIGETSSSLNLHEFNYNSNVDEYMYTSQTPNPVNWYFNDDHTGFIPVPNHNITLSSITDSNVFIQTNPNYWDNSSLLIWTNPNRVVLAPIDSFSPELRTVYFDNLHAEAIYPDGRDQGYAIYNSIHALDQPGEYHVNFKEGRIYIYPKSDDNIDLAFSISIRPYGFNINTANGITIEGFIVRKHSGDGLRSGIGIGSFNNAEIEKNYYTIRNNYIYHNCHPERGYGGIFLSNVNNTMIENNILEDNFRHRGIFCSGAKNAIVKRNKVTRSGSTSITFYSMRNSQILYNSVLESQGGHANGITVYIASKDILVAGNKIIDCASPITLQDGGNIYFINNLVDSRNFNYGVNEWSRTSRGPWTYGEIVFVNNTILSIPGQSAMYLGTSTDTIYDDTDTIYGNTYFMYNNIIDAGGSAACIERANNIYTSLAWNQKEKYDWYLAENEIIQEDRNLVFIDPDNEDYRLCEGSQAIEAGTDILDLLPVDKFPDFDFTVDINQFPRPSDSPWSIGAYEYGSQVSSNNNSVSTISQHTLIYPNPFKDIIHIHSYENTQSQIYTLSGSLIVASNRKLINLESLPTGVYFIRIINDEGITTVEKIVKY